MNAFRGRGIATFLSIGGNMKFTYLLVALVFVFVGCSERSNSRPASTEAKAPSAPAPSQNNNNQVKMDDAAAKSQVQKAKDLLNAMGVETDGKDIAIKNEPTTYKEMKDLKMAFDAYQKAAWDMVNVTMTPEGKLAWQEVANSAQSFAAKYVPQRVFLKELEEIGIRESQLDAYGIHFKRVDNIWVMAIDKEFTYHYGRSEHLNVISSYIVCLEKFLQVYLDGQSPIDLETKVILEKKLVLARELAATLN